MTERVWQQIDVRVLAVLASLLLSVYTFLLPALPNDDAFVYVRTAEIYLRDGLAAAFNHYGWAGYSILIGELSRLGLTLFNAAHLLNALLFALLVYSFLSIVSRLDRSRLVMVLAAWTILLYPELNEFRYFIIRDIGFWAFSLFGLWQYLLYTEQADKRHAAAFTVAMLLAMVFRAEAILYLALLPLALLWGSPEDLTTRRRKLRTLAAVVYGSIIVLTVLLLLLGVNVFALMADFFSVYLPFLQSTFNPSEAQTAELGRLLFGEHAAAFSQDYMNAVIAAGLLVILFMTIFYGVSGAYFWMLLYGTWKKYLRFDRRVLPPILVYMAINGLVLLIFLYITRYLSSRYAIIFCLMLTLQIPLIVAAIINNARGAQWERLTRSLLVVFFVFCAFDAYWSMGRSREYLLDAAAYIDDSAGSSQQLLTNNHIIAYFSNRVEAYDEVERTINLDQIRSMKPGDYLAVELINDVQRLLEEPEAGELLQLEATFSGSGQQSVAVYRRARSG